MEKIARGSVWVALGIFMLLFYALYVIDMTYYNPFALWVMIFLSMLVAILGVFESFRSPPFGKIRSLEAKADTLGAGIVKIFPPLFYLTFGLLILDVLLTLYAVSAFGLNVERNAIVRELLRQGNAVIWVAKQLAPAIVTGTLYMVLKDLRARRFLAAFILGTAVYATLVVTNNAAFLIQRLSGA